MTPMLAETLLASQSDARLASLARRGHERAFEVLVHRYRRPLLSYCRRLGLPETRAEDVVQQALLSAWVSLQDGPEILHPRAWLYRIVHNAAVNARARAGYDYDELSDHLVGSPPPQEHLERRQTLHDALEGLAGLPLLQREALVRTALAGYSQQEVAEELGITDAGVRGLVYRGRAALRAVASALTPAPLIEWAANAGATTGVPIAERVSEAVAGAGAGAGAVLVKAGVVGLSTAAVAAGVMHHELHSNAPDTLGTPAAAAAAPRTVPRAQLPAGGVSPASVPTPATPASERQRSSHRRDRHEGRGSEHRSDEHGRRHDGGDDRGSSSHSGSGSGAAPTAVSDDHGGRRLGSGTDDSSGRGGATTDDSGHHGSGGSGGGSSGSDSDDGSHSGSGSGSKHGGSSGSGTSGGSSGSGETSGSGGSAGSSGSGETSGSGSSGGGTSTSGSTGDSGSGGGTSGSGGSGSGSGSGGDTSGSGGTDGGSGGGSGSGSSGSGSGSGGDAGSGGPGDG